MFEITIDLLIKHLGQPTKETGGHVYFQCPYCQDSHRDNLIFTPNKQPRALLKCFANESHSASVLKDIFSENKGKLTRIEKSFIKHNIEKPMITAERQQKFFFYMLKCNDELLNNEKALKFLFENRGINRDTVEYCGIGIDSVKRRWVFPTFEYNCKVDDLITGFEYRPSDLSKKGLYREKNTPTCMAMINSYTPDRKCLAILEGYLDAYAFAQHLKDKGQLEYYHIATPSNGVSSIIKLIKEIDYSFNQYQRVYVYLDSDETSKPKMQEIKELYPDIKTIIMDCGCKDFNEHYLNCIGKAEQVAIKTKQALYLNDLKELRYYIEDDNLFLPPEYWQLSSETEMKQYRITVLSHARSNGLDASYAVLYTNVEPEYISIPNNILVAA